MEQVLSMFTKYCTPSENGDFLKRQHLLQVVGHERLNEASGIIASSRDVCVLDGSINTS